MATNGTAQRSHSFSWIRLALVLTIITLTSPSCSESQNITRQNQTGICTSVEVRNRASELRKLKGCRVVEGFVRILLMEIEENELSQMSFPELIEITDYLLLYRVIGVRSLGRLFPNLAVIRGQNTFYDYALVVFNMYDLQEIALHSLTDIPHGLVRIEKNPSLCFVGWIGWDVIAHEKGQHVVKRLDSQCPGDETLRKICPNRCRYGCNERGECCNANCLGGCSKDDVNLCLACRNLRFGTECVSNCPDGYYEYLGLRCVHYDECIGMKPPFYSESELVGYKIFNTSCTLECPRNFMSDNINHTCIPCNGTCKKKCPGLNLNNITLAEQLRGCTHITGNLEIQLSGGSNVVEQLQENLGAIEEIDGYLKVFRSFPLVSLDFLRNLKIIRGNHVVNRKYALVVVDNQNLHDLWRWEDKTIQIDSGRLFFHLNPKLCLKKIEKLQKKANLRPFTELDVASNSNGNAVACEVENLEVSIRFVNSEFVVLTWRQFELQNQHNLLGYIIYYIEAQHQNVTLYDGTDVCGEDRWRVDVVNVHEDDIMTITHTLGKLKPYSQYAFFVKTYTIAGENRGAESRLQYFRTRPYPSSEPLALQATSNASDAIVLSWAPPLHPNGNVTHYLVTGRKHSYIEDSTKRDYCKVKDQPIKSYEPQLLNAEFEDKLQNAVYVKRKTRQKRQEVLNVHVYGKQVYLTQLQPCTWYDWYVQACREQEGPDDTEIKCGQVSIITARTLPEAGADEIGNVQVTSSEVVSVTWEPQIHPNGIIYSYFVEYKKVENENSEPTLECVRHSHFVNSKMHHLKNLPAGNYSLRVFARTSCSSSLKEQYSPYIYFHVHGNTSNTIKV